VNRTVTTFRVVAPWEAWAMRSILFERSEP